jgi:DamX protein
VIIVNSATKWIASCEKPDKGANTVDEVLSRLGLNVDPFDDVVIDGMFFTGAGRGALIDELIHQVRYGEGVCLVSGPTGIGKTRLWHHLPQLAPADTFCVSTQARLFLSAEQFFALCLGSDEDAAQEEEFLGHLEQLAQEQRQHWLLIDDAHELHDSLYKKLAQWCAQYRAVLRVVLFADDSLKYRLQNPAFNFALSYWELQPLNELEVAEYLMYRLQYCGWTSADLPFSPEDLDQISRHSEGVPLHIHDLAIAVLQKSDEQVAPSWQRLMRWPYLHIGLLLLAGSCLAVVWMGGDGGATSASTDQPQAVAEVSHPLAAGSAPNTNGAAATADTAAPASATGGPATIEFRSTMQQTPPAAAQTATVATPPVAANAPPPIPGNAASQGKGATGPQVYTVDSTPINTGESSTPAAATTPATSAVTPAPAPASKPSTPAAVATAPNLQQKNSQQKAPPPEKAPQLATKPAPAVKPAPVAKPAPAKAQTAAASKPAPAAAAAATSSGLAGLPSQHYVVQLLATADPARVASFRRELPADLKLASYQRITSGQRWHVLVYGDFPSIAQARAAINQLPAIAREQKPWAKPVSQIHKEMATVKQ